MSGAQALTEVEEALLAQRLRPDSLGPTLRAIRLAGLAGRADLSRFAARAFATAVDAGPQAEEALVALSAQAPARVYEHGERIVQEGEVGDSFFVILRGEVTVWRAGSGQAATLGAGDVFGEIALLAKTARTASVLGRGEAHVLEIPRQTIHALEQYCPQALLALEREYRPRILAQILPALGVFEDGPAHVPTEEIEALFRRFVPCTVKAGTRVLHAGVPGLGLCVVVSGRAMVWRAEPDGQNRVLAELRDGELFGEISLLFDVPVTANVDAATTLTFYTLPREDFLNFARSQTAAGRRVMALASARMGHESEG